MENALTSSTTKTRVYVHRAPQTASSSPGRFVATATWWCVDERGWSSKFLAGIGGSPGAALAVSANFSRLWHVRLPP
jgi:hypothetical protein